MNNADKLRRSMRPGIDHLNLRLEVCQLFGGGCKIELLLHGRDIGVSPFDDQTGRCSGRGIAADVSIDHNHLGTLNKFVLKTGDPVAFFATDALAGMCIGMVGDDVGRARAARDDLSFDVVVAEFCEVCVGHFAYHSLQVRRIRIGDYGLR